MDLWERIWKEFKGEDFRCQRASELERLQEYFGDELSETLLEDFFEDKQGQRDLVLENLQSHDSRKMLEKIQEKFGNFLPRLGKSFDYPYREEEKGYVALRTVGPRATKALKDSEEFKSLVHFYGYNISRVAGSIITLEPEYPEEGQNVGGHGYHLIYNRQVPGAPEGYTVLDSVLDHGLRVKDSKHRYYPKRVYMFFYGPVETQEALERLRQDGEEINMFDYMWEDGDIKVVKFRIPEGIKWYRDPVMEGPAYFTYSSIPAKYIEQVF